MFGKLNNLRINDQVYSHEKGRYNFSAISSNLAIQKNFYPEPKKKIIAVQTPSNVVYI